MGRYPSDGGYLFVIANPTLDRELAFLNLKPYTRISHPNPQCMEAANMLLINLATGEELFLVVLPSGKPTTVVVRRIATRPPEARIRSILYPVALPAMPYRLSPTSSAGSEWKAGDRRLAPFLPDSTF